MKCINFELLPYEEQSKLQNENAKIIEKFDEFLKRNRKLNVSKTDRLAKSMRKYVDQELTGK
jgi:ClpP class serine protease